MAKRKVKKARTKRRAVKLEAGKLLNLKIPKRAVTLLVQLHARPGQENMLEAELSALLHPTRKEQGCLLYDLHRSAETPGNFLFHEIWATRDAHTAHTKTPHFLRWDANKDSMLQARGSTFWTRLK